ncbi:MAG: carbohydrate-binding domain-containing protein, partial [Clostridia bacterium]|nr:carbohydrate-binding domain-containing protein [Clostridia bacterium]
MKRNSFTRTLGILLSLLLLVGAIPLAALPVAAQNIIGMMSASYIRAGEDIVLFGDTTLVMDQDLTVPSIQGDYHLTIEGSGKLTVNGGGNGIDVKSLHCTSDLFIQTGWHAIEVSETVYIQNADSFIVGGIYAGGHIDIRSNNATIAGNGNAIFSSLGNITLSGGTFDIGANGIAVAAETGGIYMTGNFTVNSNNGRTIDTAKGEVVIDGSLKSTSGAQFDPEVHFANRDWFSIGAASGFSFYGTTLEVTGLGGILAGVNAGYSDISITADSVSIITERYYALYGNYIYVDSDELWLENEG